ncbi:hypothetical protein O3P69_009926 [Scylla paramamosain]|uniref:Uncharacterized protein n=1 Tax=Scylla paramamosain TaxID=85552 RepID=A0AAW0SMR9_SCYPA
MRQIENSRKSGAGTDDVYSPKLWCFDELSFLNDGGITRTSQSNIDPDSNKAVEEHNDHESLSGNLPEYLLVLSFWLRRNPIDSSDTTLLQRCPSLPVALHADRFNSCPVRRVYTVVTALTSSNPYLQ